MLSHTIAWLRLPNRKPPRDLLASKLQSLPSHQDTLQAGKVIPRRSNTKCMRARGINSNHSSDGRRLSVGWIGRKVTSRRSQPAIQLGQRNPRLHPNCLVTNTDDLIHVSGEIDHDSVPEAASCNAGPGASRDHRNCVAGSERSQRGNVRRICRKSDSRRFDFVEASVRGIERSRNVVHTLFAAQRVRKLLGNLSTNLIQMSTPNSSGKPNAAYDMVSFGGDSTPVRAACCRSASS